MLVSARSTTYFSFRCAQLSALRTSFSIDRSCFSTRTVWDGYRYEASLIDDTRHRGQLVRVSAKFQALKNTERQGLDGKTAIVVLGKKCGTKPYPNRASQCEAPSQELIELYTRIARSCRADGSLPSHKKNIPLILMI